jgi:hypothetical protein
VDTNPDPFPAMAVAFAIARPHLRMNVDTTCLTRSSKEALSKLAEANFVLSPDAEMPGINRHLPGVQIQPFLNDVLSNTPSFDRKMVDTIQGRPLWLFIRRCETGQSAGEPGEGLSAIGPDARSEGGQEGGASRHPLAPSCGPTIAAGAPRSVGVLRPARRDPHPVWQNAVRCVVVSAFRTSGARKCLP